jgi:hypothetical protein
MKRASVLAYPALLIICESTSRKIVPHSNRIKAAGSLKLGRATDEEIAFRLCWHISSEEGATGT